MFKIRNSLLIFLNYYISVTELIDKNYANKFIKNINKNPIQNEDLKKKLKYIKNIDFTHVKPDELFKIQIKALSKNFSSNNNEIDEIENFDNLKNKLKITSNVYEKQLFEEHTYCKNRNSLKNIQINEKKNLSDLIKFLEGKKDYLNTFKLNKLKKNIANNRNIEIITKDAKLGLKEYFEYFNSPPLRNNKDINSNNQIITKDKSTDFKTYLLYLDKKRTEQEIKLITNQIKYKQIIENPNLKNFIYKYEIYKEIENAKNILFFVNKEIKKLEEIRNAKINSQINYNNRKCFFDVSEKQLLNIYSQKTIKENLQIIANIFSDGEKLITYSILYMKENNKYNEIPKLEKLQSNFENKKKEFKNKFNDFNKNVSYNLETEKQEIVQNYNLMAWYIDRYCNNI
jgi:hypothetical protein